MRYHEIIDEAAPDTPEFRRWFGQSKILDAQGQPMRLYHGTLSDIQIFKPGDGRNGSVLGNGVMYFTADPRDAGGYGRENVEQARASGRRFPKEYLPGANIVPVYLKIENPLLYQPDMALGNELVKFAKAEGHDGIVFSTGRDDINKYREVVAFRSEQIKFAITP
jgi:hypothetical protein